MTTILAPTEGTRVSVLTPVFNGAMTVAAAIASVRAQSLTDWEMIVVDDGSTDGTAREVERLADHCVRFARQVHGGTAAARNDGLRVACGAFVAFLDADDLWTPDYLRRMTSALAARPDAVLAFATWQYVDEHGHLLPQRVTPFDGDPARAVDELTWRNSLVPSAVVVRRTALIRTGGFDPSFRICADWDLWLRLRAEGPFVYVPGALALYRARTGSLIEDVEATEGDRLRLYDKHQGTTAVDPALWPAARRRAVGHTLFVAGLAYLRRWDDGLGLPKIRRALEVWPGLAEDDELYYELACARQPRGQRVGSAALDFAETVRLITLVMPEAQGPAVHARVRLALGNLALFSGDRRAAAGHAVAVLVGPDRRELRRAAGLLAAAALPLRVSRRLRAWRVATRERARARKAGRALRTPASRCVSP